MEGWTKMRCLEGPNYAQIDLSKFGKLSRLALPPKTCSQPRGREPLQGQPHRRGRHPDPAGDLVAGDPGDLQPKHLAHLAHRDPLCWHRPLPRQKPTERTLSGPAEAPLSRATSSRNPGRLPSESAASVFTHTLPGVTS